MIVRPGTYVSPHGKYDLTVTLASGIVNYSVTTASTGKKVASAGGFSDSHRWFFFWDQQNRLWSYNSDMGPFGLWQDDANGVFAMKIVSASSPLLASMPKTVYDYLPNRMKRVLQIESGLPSQAP